MKTKEKFAVMLVDGQVKYILGTQGLQFPPQYTRGTPMADPAASLSHCHTVTVSCHTTDNCKLSRSRVTQNTAPLPATGHWPAAARTVVISPNTNENLLFYYSTHFSLQGPGIKHFTMPEIRLLGLLAPINYTALPVTDSREHTWPRVATPGLATWQRVQYYISIVTDCETLRRSLSLLQILNNNCGIK